MAKLLAIDGLRIVRRVYEANTEADPEQRADDAVRHALSSFRKLLSVQQPTHAFAAFDAGGHTWRHDIHPAYRAGHAPPPADLVARLLDLHAQLQALGLAVLGVPGVSGDDVIATAVMRWLDEGRGEAVVAPGDKDLHVLVAHGALIWDHFKGEWHDRAWVEEKYGIAPELLPDLLALVGDKADGVPGVSKVGMKTGARLLQSYGSLDGVLQGAGILMNPLGERLRKERDMLELSRRLVALKTDATLGVSWKMLAFAARP
ncbi:MAG TPA: 5'-3' exonuclease H3TH domain-containing protein [Noviherbaspirillum sp.]|jgi:DNA polymerase-1|uniref:5'-3' exonuclease n=1 Tax=Noviherbaspirillum sp. TaxID=1926288 RepID=UPI002F95C219